MATLKSAPTHWFKTLIVIFAAHVTVVVPAQAAETSTRIGDDIVLTGTLSGRVTHAQSGQPLSSVQVSLPGLSIGGLTRADGTYQLENVPLGSYRLRAQQMGYRVMEAEIIITAGQVTVADFVLSPEALALDQIVVTGTAGGTQRRAIGNVVESVDLAEVLSSRAGAITNVEQVLSGRLPGVEFIPPPGVAGGGGQVRIRGSSSVTLAGDPIVYIDGVRMNSERGQANRHTSVSRLNDIDPRDIESIEIIKGPAAATLYGTEAANGVIQIITKRGTAGDPSFSASVELGATSLPLSYVPTLWAPDISRCPKSPCQSIEELIPLNLYDIERAEQGRRIFETGINQRYNLSVQGGAEAGRYYASFNRSDQQGVVDWNWDKRNSARGSLWITPSPTLSLQLTGGYSTASTADAGSFWATNFAYGGRPAAYLLGDPGRGFNAPPESFGHDSRSVITDTERSTWSVEVRHVPIAWLSHRLVFGIDRFNETNTNQIFKDAPAAQFTGRCGTIGCKTINRTRSPVTTLDLSGSASFRLTDALSSQTSYGLQYYGKSTTLTNAYGEGFATSNLKTVSSAAVTTGGETYVENTTVGVYAQQQFGWQDRIFVTGALRADDNSAFGQNFDAAIYPKLSGTWVMHEESFWNLDLVSQMRLRGAWGAAGQQPDAFAASRLYNPGSGPGGQPILTLGTFGNPDLGPERGEELELGFDAEIAGNISISYTRFSRKTKDALVPRPIAPSLGFEGEAGATSSTGGAFQLVNIGLISAWGHELAIGARVLDRHSLSWDLNLAFTSSSNRIDDLTGAGRIQVQRGRAHQEGFPLASIIDYKVVSADFRDGVSGGVTNIMCDGGTGPGNHSMGGEAVPCDEAPRVYWGRTEPRWVANLGSTWTIFEDFSLSASLVSQGGHWMSSDYLGARHTTSPSSELVYLQDNAIGMAYLNVTRSGLTYHKAGFVKLREVSLSYSLPVQVAERLGASRVRVSAGVRNAATLYLRQQCPEAEPRTCAPDPEMNRPDENFWGEAGGGWPPLRQATFTVNWAF